ncbi:MAG: SDR family NAD(P)-dependent oxidoreductase [Planctomycetes bacterium]|nr:SDR family NAD(P)-dependent oxidoreductase [Planctomycetota bacterium]
MTQNAIILGATSGIGKELARMFCHNGYVVGLAGRRTHLLSELKREFPDSTFIKTIDIAKTIDAMVQLNELISEMKGVDIIIISSGIGFINHELQWPQEKDTIDVNVTGFAAMANIAIHHFLQKGSGHFVGISSISAIRGDNDSPAYNASKSFISNYMEGLRKKVVKSGASISVTDIQPGFVDTAMAKGEGLFWVATPQKAAQQIYNAIQRKKKHAYITKRWMFIGWLMKMMPDFIYNRI